MKRIVLLFLVVVLFTGCAKQTINTTDDYSPPTICQGDISLPKIIKKGADTYEINGEKFTLDGKPAFEPILGTEAEKENIINLFNQVKIDLEQYLMKYKIEVKERLDNLHLYVTCDLPDDVGGVYNGEKIIYINENLDLTDMQIKVIMMHEIVHYLIFSSNISINSLFINSIGGTELRWLNEGLATYISETYYNKSFSAYAEQYKIADTFIRVYGNDLILDAFTGRDSVIKQELKAYFGEDIYEGILIPYDFYTISLDQKDLKYRSYTIYFLQDFLLNYKGFNENIIALG